MAGVFATSYKTEVNLKLPELFHTAHISAPFQQKLVFLNNKAPYGHRLYTLIHLCMNTDILIVLEIWLHVTDFLAASQ